MGYIAIQPLFEGFDENSHYSSIREIAETGQTPLYGISKLDRFVESYALHAPMPYGTLAPPFDTHMTYAKFFADGTLAENYTKAYREALPPPYVPGKKISWEAQHPPLYYSLLAPLERSTRNLSLVSQVTLLRLASFFLAVCGVALMAFDAAKRKDLAACAGLLFYPLLLPMFFPEMARMGNDSLCLLVCSVLFLLLRRYVYTPSGLKALGIGVILGIGMLSKAFFLPITAALLLWLLASRYLEKGHTRHAPLRDIFIILAGAFLCGGAWYVYRLAIHQPIIGFDEPELLARQGGLLKGLQQHFSLYALAQGFAVNLATWIWMGTWSMVRMPSLMYAPVIAALALVAAAFARRLQEKPLSDQHWLTLFLLALFALGFIRHMFISIALKGVAGTPANYLHILFPWVASAIGLGASLLLRHRLARMVLYPLLAYGICFQCSAIWAELALFTGCATKGDDKSYVFSDGGFCFGQTGTIMQRLGILGWPHLAVTAFAAGALCYAIACIMFIRNSHYEGAIRE